MPNRENIILCANYYSMITKNDSHDTDLVTVHGTSR